MKKNGLLALLIIVSQTQIARSQDIGEIWNCYTVNQTTKSLKFVSLDNEDVDESIKIVNIFYHVIRRNDGSGGLTDSEISANIDRLNNDYRQYNIIINELGRDNINNTSFYDGITDYSYDQLINTNRINNAINIYLLAPLDSYSKAESIPGKALCIGGIYTGRSVITHETGHCLGLFHTHSGSGCYDFYNCQESIIRIIAHHVEISSAIHKLIHV